MSGQPPRDLRTAQIAAGIAAGGCGAIGAFLAAKGAMDADLGEALLGAGVVVAALALGFILPIVLRSLAAAEGNAQRLTDIQKQLETLRNTGNLTDQVAEMLEKLNGILQWTWLSDAAKRALARPVELERFRRAVEELAAREEYDEALRLIDLLENHFELPREAHQMRIRVEDGKFRAADGQAREQINLVRRLTDEDNFVEARRHVNAFRKSFVGDPRADDLEKTVQRARVRRYEALRAEWDRSVETFNLNSCEMLIEKLRQVAEPGELPRLEADLERVDQAAQRALKDRFGEQVRNHEWSVAIETGVEILSRYPHSTMAAEFRRMRPHLMDRARSDPSPGRPTAKPERGKTSDPAGGEESASPEPTE